MHQLLVDLGIGERGGDRLVELHDDRRRGEDEYDTFYRPEIRFAYSVGGRSYSTNTFKTGGSVGYGTPARAEAIVGRYQQGQAVTVHYNPAHPDTALLETANVEGVGVLITVGTGFALAGALFTIEPEVRGLPPATFG